MIEHKRFSVTEMPYIPEDAEFMLGNVYARTSKKNKKGELFLWCFTNYHWIATGQSLDEYNTYYTKETHEKTLREVIDHLPRKNYYFFKNEKDEYHISYNKPVDKGYKDKDGNWIKRLKAGETFSLSQTTYPQICHMIDVKDGLFDLYSFESLIKWQFEYEEITKGEIISEFFQDTCSYYDLALDKKWKKFLEEFQAQMKEWTVRS